MEYSASFTAGGILYNEFESVLPFIVEGEEMKKFLDLERKENKYLKITTESARIRVTTELKKRLKVVDIEFWKFYENSTPEERRMLLFYLCVKTYPLVRDYHFKVTLPSYLAYQWEVFDSGYKMFLDELTSKNEEVGSWSESTKRKTITNYIRMLNEAGFIIDNKIIKSKMNDHFYCYFLHTNQPWALDIFLLSNEEKKSILNICS